MLFPHPTTCSSPSSPPSIPERALLYANAATTSLTYTGTRRRVTVGRGIPLGLCQYAMGEGDLLPQGSSPPYATDW